MLVSVSSCSLGKRTSFPRSKYRQGWIRPYTACSRGGVLTVQRKMAEALVNRGSKNISECLAQASSIPPLIDASILSSRDILEICPRISSGGNNPRSPDAACNDCPRTPRNQASSGIAPENPQPCSAGRACSALHRFPAWKVAESASCKIGSRRGTCDRGEYFLRKAV